MRLRRKSIVLAAAFGVLAAIVAAWIIVGTLSPDAPPDSPVEPFSWAQFLPERSDDEPNWQRVVDNGHLATFDALRDALIENTITPDALVGFEFILDQATLQNIQPLLPALETDDRNAAVKRLYAKLMSAPSSPDVLLEKLEDRLGRAFTNAEEDPDDNGRRFGWAVAINTYAALLAYQNTRDPRFIDMAADALERSLAYRDSEIGRVDEFRGRAMHSWGGTRYVEDQRHSTNVTLGGRMAFVLALFADIVRQDDALQDDYGYFAGKFIEAAQLAMDEYTPEFELTADGTMGYYVRPTHDNDIEPLNHMAWAGNALILLHELTGDEQYGTMAEQLARFFRHCMRTGEHGELYWRYQPTHEDFFGKNVEWVWKSRTTTQFIHFAWQRGVVFADEDVQAVATMMLTNVFRPDGRISARIDPQFHDMEEFAGFRGNYLATTPYILLDDVSPELRDRIEDLVASRPDIGGWMFNRHGVIAYAHRMRDAHE